MAHVQSYQTARREPRIKKRRKSDQSTGIRFLRIMLVGSLYFKLRHCVEPTEAELIRLNQLIPVVTRIDALWPAGLLAPFLWKKLDICSLLAKLRDGEITVCQAVDLVKHTVPRFARYVGIDTDINKLLADGIDQ